MDGLMDPLWCSIGLLVTPAFLCLTGVALLSTLIPFLKELALHGKTRSKHGTDDPPTQMWCGQYWHYFLHGDILLINKRCFLHFYVAGLLSLAAFLLLSTRYSQKLIRWDLALLTAIHLLRRWYECRKVHRYSETSRMHIAGYICGIFHYLFLPFMVFGVVCNSTGERESVNDGDAGSSNLYSLSCVVLCLWGQFEQFYHHYLLSSLRQPTGKEGSDQTRRHKIPRGRWFQYVSCPHYLAEIIIYISFALLIEVSSSSDDISSCSKKGEIWQALPAVFQQPTLLGVLLALRRFRHYVLLLWVTCNLTVTALRSHQWYLESFPSYHTLKRKAICPWIL